MKEYLEGKLKLKNPTLKDMCKVASLFKDDCLDVMAGEGMIEALCIVCEGDRETIENLDPKLGQEILKDFFYTWNPLEWISGNTAILTDGKKLSPSRLKGLQDIKKP